MWTHTSPCGDCGPKTNELELPDSEGWWWEHSLEHGEWCQSGGARSVWNCYRCYRVELAVDCIPRNSPFLVIRRGFSACYAPTKGRWVKALTPDEMREVSGA